MKQHPVTDVWWKQLVPCLRCDHIFLKLLAQDRHDLHTCLGGIPTVGPDHQSAPAIPRDAALDQLLQLITPIVTASLEDVEGIADAGHQATGIL